MGSINKQLRYACISALLMTASGLPGYAQTQDAPPAPPEGELLSLPPLDPAANTGGTPGAPTAPGMLSLPPGQPAALPTAPPASAVISAPSPENTPATATTTVPVTEMTEEQKAEATMQALLPNPLDIVSNDGFQASYGAWPYSLMYPPEEMTNLKNILALYERKGFIVEQEAAPSEETAQPSVEEIYQKLQQTPLPPNLVFPSFKLRSIIYRHANDWSVWLNNRRITNETNKPENELSVVAISKDFVEFAWVPGNAELLSAILQTRLLPAASRPPTSPTPTHRKAIAAHPEGWLDRSTSIVHFILRPNQVFYAETFEVFEGTPNALSASISRAIQLEKEPNAASATPQNDPTQIIKDLQKQLDAAERRPPPGQSSPDAAAPAPATPSAADTTKDFINQKQNPKAQMMRTLGIGK